LGMYEVFFFAALAVAAALVTAGAWIGLLLDVGNTSPEDWFTLVLVTTVALGVVLYRFSGLRRL
jgi:hypothetical protein